MHDWITPVVELPPMLHLVDYFKSQRITAKVRSAKELQESGRAVSGTFIDNLNLDYNWGVVLHPNRFKIMKEFFSKKQLKCVNM